MEVAARKINFTKKMVIVPISDLHLMSPACDMDKLYATRKWILAEPHRYIIGVGDYVDLILRQDLARFAAGCTTLDIQNIDDAMNYARRAIIDFFKPLADEGRLLGLGWGNHEYEVHKRHAYNIMKDVCEELDTPDLGYSFFYRLTLTKGKCNTKRNCVIYGHHGYGGGRKPGASINKLVDMATIHEADIIISGHDHYKLGKRLIRLQVTQTGPPKIVNKPIVVARTGTFLKTSIPGHITYSEKAGFPPTDTGVVRLYIDFKGADKNLDIHVSE